MAKIDDMSEEQAMKLLFAGLAYAEDADGFRDVLLKIHESLKDNDAMIEARKNVEDMLNGPLNQFPMDVSGIDFEEKYNVGAAIVCVISLFDFLETEAVEKFDKELAAYEKQAQEKVSSFQEEHL